jgi:microcompartment protein CcmL/EutN
LQARIQAGAAQAAQARVDATGLSPSCGCVFALVVSGPVAQLQQLAHHAGVRILDPAPVGASLSSLMIVPLEPQVTDLVPALSFAGD